jgi:hypothetical protein
MLFPDVVAVSDRPAVPLDLVRTIRELYLRSIGRCGGVSGIWDSINSLKGDIHAALCGASDEDLASLLSRPTEHFLLYGIDDLSRDDGSMPLAERRRLQADATGESLYRLAELLKVVRMRYPEARVADPPFETDALLDGIAGAVGQFDLPNPFVGEVGLKSTRGIFGFRVPQALYQAHLLKQWPGSILEIGAGFGRTAYFAHKFGLGPYSIVDIPMTNVAQRLFLGMTLPEGAVRILDTSELPAADVVFNADSLTEMDRETAERYVDHIKRTAKVFLSINHEYNAFRACEVGDLARHCVSRNAYYLRPGYAMEVFHF